MTKWPVKPFARSVTDVEPHTHSGVRVDHPSLVSSIQNMVKQGKSNEEILRVIGQPVEVIDRIRHKISKEKVQKS